MLGDSLLDELDADRMAAFFVENFTEDAFDDFDAELFACERRERSDSDESAFKPANIRSDTVGEEIDDIVRQLDTHELRFLVENGEAHFNVGRLQVGNQTPLETRDEAMFEILNFAGWTVAGQNNLFMGLVESVEGMEEFFLDALFAGKELDVVDQEDIGLAILLAELDKL